MKFQTVFLKDPAHGKLAVCGHSLALGNEGITSMEYDAPSQMFVVTLKDQKPTHHIPVSNVRNAIGIPVETNVSQKGK